MPLGADRHSRCRGDIGQRGENIETCGLVSDVCHPSLLLLSRIERRSGRQWSCRARGSELFQRRLLGLKHVKPEERKGEGRSAPPDDERLLERNY